MIILFVTVMLLGNTNIECVHSVLTEHFFNSVLCITFEYMY